MTKQQQQLEELKKLIKVELGACNMDLWPQLCRMQSTEKGYKAIEGMIIRYVAEEGMPIGAAIAHIEQELAHQEQS